MIDVAEWVAERIYALRITRWEQWLLRGLVLAAGLGAALLASVWVTPVLLTPWWTVTGVLLAGAVLWPESPAPLLMLAPLVVAWLGGGAADSWGSQLAVVAVVAVFHLGVGYAAAAPTFAAVRGAAWRKMGLALVSFTAVSTVVAAVLLGWVHG